MKQRKRLKYTMTSKVADSVGMNGWDGHLRIAQKLSRTFGYPMPYTKRDGTVLILRHWTEHMGQSVITKKSRRPGTAPIKDEFLASYEWRRVRMEALKKYGPRCQCCGAGAADGRVMNVDHIKPRKIYPELALALDNLQVLCDVCNHGKGNWDMTDWRANADTVKAG